MNEIQLSFTHGATVYAQVRSTSGTIWNGTGWESYSTLDIANYAVSMSEQGTASAFFTGNFPSIIGPGVYNVICKSQIGGTPAESDPTVGVGEIQWAGSGGPVRSLSDFITSGSTYLPNRITKGYGLSGFAFKLVSSADHITPITSGVCSGQVNKNSTGWVSLQSGLVSSAYTELGYGWYAINLTSGDTNADVLAFHFIGVGVSGGLSDPRDMVVYTQKG